MLTRKPNKTQITIRFDDNFSESLRRVYTSGSAARPEAMGAVRPAFWRTSWVDVCSRDVTLQPVRLLHRYFFLALVTHPPSAAALEHSASQPPMLTESHHQTTDSLSLTHAVLRVAALGDQEPRWCNCYSWRDHLATPVRFRSRRRRDRCLPHYPPSLSLGTTTRISITLLS